MPLNLHRIFPKIFFQSLAIFLKTAQNFLPNVQKIYSKSGSPFIRNAFLIFWRFSNIFSVFSKCYLDFSIIYISVKFLQSFLKPIAKFFRISKFHQKLRNTNFCTLMFPHRFFKISFKTDNNSKLPLLMSATPLKENWKFSRNFIKHFWTTLPTDFKMSQ